MSPLKTSQLAWAAVALTLVGASLWLGALDAGRHPVPDGPAAGTPRPASPSRLVLPAPPPLPDAKQAAPGSDQVAAENAAAPGRSSIPPPGGFPVDVMLEMWEVSLRTPRAISATPLTAENWFITGVVVRGTEQQVIVQRGNDPKAHFHKVGDLLPGGSRIAWVRPNAIGLITPKREAISLPVQH